jgi:hypothetical protein
MRWRGCRIYLLQFKDGTWTDVLGRDHLQHRHWWQIFMLSMLSINHGIQLDSVEMVEAGEKVDSKERQQNVGLAVSLWKQKGDVAQLVRALPCHGRGRGFEPRRPRHSFQRV